MSASRPPAGVMPLARHWMRRSFIMRCFRVSFMASILHMHMRHGIADRWCSLVLVKLRRAFQAEVTALTQHRRRRSFITRQFKVSCLEEHSILHMHQQISYTWQCSLWHEIMRLKGAKVSCVGVKAYNPAGA